MMLPAGKIKATQYLNSKSNGKIKKILTFTILSNNPFVADAFCQFHFIHLFQ